MSMDKRPSTAQEEQAPHDDKCWCVECEHINYKSKPINELVSAIATLTDHDVARGTGRTKRMLLKAAIRLSENNEVTVVIAAETAAYAKSLKHDLLDILCVTFGKEFTASHCVSRIKCCSHRELENLGYNYSEVFVDHYRRV